MQKKKIIIYIAGIVLLMLLVLFIWKYCFKEKNQEVEPIILQYGNTIQDLPLKNKDGETVDQISLEHEVNLVIYLSDTCKSCMDVMETLKEIRSIFGEEELGYAYVYVNRIPANIGEKYAVPREECYSLDQQMLIATSLPTFYIVDREGKIEYITIDLSLAIEKLVNMELVDKETLMKRADCYLLENYFDSTISKDKLVYFEMEGCQDCEAANEVIDTAEIQERYEILRIYTYMTDNSELFIDRYELYKIVYGLDWYPSFRVLRGNESELIGEVSIEELRNILLE